MKKFLFNFLLFLLLTGGGWSIVYRQHLVAFPHIISSFYAKEFCSCYFILKRSEKDCHNYSRQWIPISDFSIDSTNQMIRVTGLGITNRAQMDPSLASCVLEKWQ